MKKPSVQNNKIKLNILKQLLVGLLLGGALATAGAQAPASTASAGADPATYFGVYLNKGKLGSATMVRDAHATFHGAPAVKTEMTMRMNIKIEGYPSTNITITDISWRDPKTGAPLGGESTSDSSGHTSDVVSVYTGNAVTYAATIQGAKQTGTLTLKPGEHFLTDPTDGNEVKPKVGMHFSGEIFVSDAPFRLMASESTILSKETVEIGGVSVAALKSVTKNIMETSTQFSSEAGDLLEIDNSVANIPMKIVREPKEMALAPVDEKARPDISAMTNIHPTGESLEAKARTAGSITYQISGLTHDFAPSDTVQAVSYVKTASADPDRKEQTATVTVHAAGLPTGPTAPVFAHPADAPAALQPFLASTLYVPASDPTFQSLAKSIVGDEKDCGAAARKIAAYVHETVKADPSIAALRTAADIRQDPRGVCRDYTTFFTAIARAAGIPTKQCVGVGYVGGIFGYHAWPEVWVGKDTTTGADHWVALEPTWGMPFADATHIKLVEGEVEDLYLVTTDMGHYKIKVVSVD